MIDDKLTSDEAKKFYSDNKEEFVAFIHGVEWAEEQFGQIWHNVKEVPSKYMAIICLCYISPLNKNLTAETVTAEQLFNRIDDWHDINKSMRTVKWAYIDDIVKISRK